MLQQSKIKRKLRFLARHFNFAIPPRLRKNFTQPTSAGIEEFTELLKTKYFPNWYKNIDIESFCNSRDGQIDIENHIFYRLEQDRYRFIPWIDSIISLNNIEVLEVGCGTGSSTVSLAEQGAIVTALDVDAEAIKLTEARCRIHGIRNVSLLQENATDIKKLVSGRQFDLIIFFAVLEHMTLEERKLALRAAWEMLPTDKYLCITNTPNRFWLYDGHTSYLPFFNWLPDELAFEYSQFSPRYPFNKQFRSLDNSSMLQFIRQGRGMSFHELDISLGLDCKYSVVSDLTGYLWPRNPVVMLKRVLKGEFKLERLLNSYAPDRHRCFFRQDLDLIIKKLH